MGCTASAGGTTAKPPINCGEALNNSSLFVLRNFGRCANIPQEGNAVRLVRIGLLERLKTLAGSVLARTGVSVAREQFRSVMRLRADSNLIKFCEPCVNDSNHSFKNIIIDSNKFWAQQGATLGVCTTSRKKYATSISATSTADCGVRGNFDVIKTLPRHSFRQIHLAIQGW